MKTLTGDRTLQISREFKAPQELVFDAFTSPEKIGRWWGPNGFTTTTKSMEFKEGGEWIFTMHGPDGIDYPNRILYTEINQYDLIAYDHSGNRPDEEVHFHQTITFEEVNGQTKVTFNLLFPTLKAKEEAAEFGAIKGGQQTLARLDDYLQTV